MRHPSVSVAAAVLLLLAGLIFWPSSPRGPLPGVSQAVAQEAGTAVAKEAAQETRKQTSSKDENNAVTEKLLSSTRMNAKFDELTLDQTIKEIASATMPPGEKEPALRYVLDVKKLGEAGALEAKITFQLRNVRLDTLLDLVLKQLGLGYYIEDGILIVTTKEEVDTRVEVRVYNCRDLLELPRPLRAKEAAPMAGDLGGGAGGGAPPVVGVPGGPPGIGPGAGGGGALGGLGAPSSGGAVELIEVLRTNIKPDSWRDAGGPGDVSEYRGLLVVSQTADVHRRIEQLLELLRSAAKDKLAK